MNQYTKLFRKINLSHLEEVLYYENIKYEKYPNYLVFGIYDNIIYFFDDKYKLYDQKNKDLIINYLNYIYNRLLSKNEVFILKNDYINNKNNLIILNNNDYYSSSNIKKISVL
tara:strand:+ start:766 stop:1104 length:339 start_codon:yes stop_codon:yes gene_type:complete